MTSTVNLATSTFAPETVPTILMSYRPGFAVLATVAVTVLVTPWEMDVGENAIVTPEGSPLWVSAAEFVPRRLERETTEVPVEFRGTTMTCGTHCKVNET